MKKLTLIGALLAAATFVPAAPAAAAPVLGVELATNPDPAAGIPLGGTAGQYEITVSNTGDAPTSAPVEVELTLPAGLKATAIYDSTGRAELEFWSCTMAPDSQSVSCTGPEDESGPLPIEPGKEACPDFQQAPGGQYCRIDVTVVPDPGLSPGDVLTPTVEVCGGGAASCAVDSHPTEIVPPPVFGIHSFVGGAFDPLGDPFTEAGSQPDIASTEFHLTTEITPGGLSLTADLFRDGIVELPPGLIGNPRAVPTCTYAVFTGSVFNDCPAETQVGIITIFVEGSGIPGGAEAEDVRYSASLFNVTAPRGTPALLGFKVIGVPLYVYAKVRTGDDYRVEAASRGAPVPVLTSGVKAEVWGVPAGQSHDRFRGKCLDVFGHISGNSCPSPVASEPRAFFTLPTSCDGPPRTALTVTSWGGGEASSSFESPANTDCASLQFNPSLHAAPTTNVADAPSGLDFNLHIPQASDHCDPGPPLSCPRAAAHLKDTTVTLPKGMAVNPASANGLGGCTSAQAGLRTPIGAKPIHFSEEAAHCPDDSKLGSVEVTTPLLDHPVKGSVYLATPYDNPFGSLLAIYITANDPISGTFATLAGEVHADPNTGQLSTTVTENPQLPIEDVSLHFDGGARGALITPPTCGTYETTSTLTPWSAAGEGGGHAVSPSDSFQIAQGPQGSCQTQESALPNSPSFDAGTVQPLAGHYSPFVLNLRREDGSQRFSAIGVKPPQGLLAKLAGTTRCSEAALASAAAKSGRAEEASPSCPASSHVGVLHAAAGAGPAPYNAQGQAYLAGPYKGAPLSLAIIAPATAGPFDLGTIVTRTALYLDPETAQISAISDPIPQILQGIPLDIRSVQLSMDRPDFTLNPTSCDPTEVSGQETTTLGQTATLQQRFQLAECTRLGFKPKLALKLKGGTKRAGHPALSATLTARAGDANIGSVSVALPRSEFLDQAHIGTVCTRVQWAADACPAGSIYGSVWVKTPLLDTPLSGNVYLRSSSNLLPDLVPDLRGPADLPIRFSAAGRTDSIHGGIRNTFSFVPDAPFTKLVVKLKGQKKGLLENSRDICAKTYRATVSFGAHNGDSLTEHPPLQAQCKGKARAKGKKRHRARAAR